MSTTASQQATIEPSSKFTPEGDTFTLGGKTFSSRLILGSGKFSLPLIKAVAEEGKAQIITLALRRATPDGQENILDFMPKDVPYCQIPQVPAQRKKRCALPNSPVPWAAAILSK